MPVLVQYGVLDTETVHICSCAQRSKGQRTQIRVSQGCTILAQDLEALFSEMLNKCRRFFTPTSQNFGKWSKILPGEAHMSLPFLCVYSTNSCYPDPVSSLRKKYIERNYLYLNLLFLEDIVTQL